MAAMGRTGFRGMRRRRSGSFRMKGRNFGGIKKGSVEETILKINRIDSEVTQKEIDEAITNMIARNKGR